MERRKHNRHCPAGRAILGLGVLLVSVRLGLGVDVYVAATGGDDSRTGLGDWNNAVATISQGVAKAVNFYTDIVLVSNGTYNLITNVNVTNGITVRGFNGRDNTFVSGGGANRCFYLNNGGILDGLTVNNGYDASAGGGAYIDMTGYVYNCTFTGNVAGNYGGGLYIVTNGLVTNCHFVGNVATNVAGALGAGGGIYILAQGVVSNCEFRFNIASNNPSGWGGGGLCASFAAGVIGTVYDSYFYANTAYTLGGGAVAHYIYNCTFVSNRGDYGGGGAYVRTFASNCVFAYNCATNGAGNGYGGGCYVYSSGSLVNCTNISYNAGKNGGGIYFNAVSTGAYLNVFSNTGSRGGGVYIVSGGGLLSNSVVYGNTSSISAGGIYLSGNFCRVVDCIFSNNTTVGSGSMGGGGIGYFAPGTDGLIQGCVIVGNRVTATTSDGTGGGIGYYYFAGGAAHNVLIRRCVIRDNSAGQNGGGINLGGNTGQVDNCLIYSNSAVSGGGVYMPTNHLLVNCTIVSNKATTSGAGIYAAGTANRVINAIVYGNSGGMLYGTNAVAFTNCCLSETNGLSGSGNFTNDPLFVSTNNFRLTSSSPCINAGTNQAWMGAAADLDGRTRIDRFGGKVDMGCYEFLHQGALFSFH